MKSLSALITLLLFTISFTTLSAKKNDVTFYDNVWPIVSDNCLNCHSEEGVSFSLENPEQAYLFKAAIASAVKDRRMPPWLAEPGHETYKEDFSLSQQQIDLIADWESAGFKKGKVKKYQTTRPHNASFKADVTLDVLQQSSYLPYQDRKDDYHCFIQDWQGTGTQYVTGFKALPGNLKVTHHLVVYVAKPEVVADFKRLDEEEAGPGYECFGSAVPSRFGDRKPRTEKDNSTNELLKKLNNEHYWLAHWAPGMDGYAFPQGTGVPVEEGSALIVQMHYYSGFAPGESDSGSKMQFTVAEHVEKPAIHFPLTNYRWFVGKKTNSMRIPPGETQTFEVSNDLERIARYASYVTGMKSDEVSAVEIHSANLHMHSYGASATTSLLDHNGRKYTLLNIPRWDLDWQLDFTFTEPKVFTKNHFEKTYLQAKCTFNNYSENEVVGGYGSDEEMCINFSYIALVPEKNKSSKKEVAAKNN